MLFLPSCCLFTFVSFWRFYGLRARTSRLFSGAESLAMLSHSSSGARDLPTHLWFWHLMQVKSRRGRIVNQDVKSKGDISLNIANCTLSIRIPVYGRMWRNTCVTCPILSLSLPILFHIIRISRSPQPLLDGISTQIHHQWNKWGKIAWVLISQMFELRPKLGTWSYLTTFFFWADWSHPWHSHVWQLSKVIVENPPWNLRIGSVEAVSSLQT